MKEKFKKYKYTLKAIKLKFSFRLLAIIEVLCAERFELTVHNKNGVQTSKTRFCKSEIENAGRKGLI